LADGERAARHDRGAGEAPAPPQGRQTRRRRRRHDLSNLSAGNTMSDRLDDYRFQMGRDAGNLAMALDTLTDAMNAAALHAVHCRVERGPRQGEPPLD